MRLKRKAAVLFVAIMAGISSLAMAADLPVTSPFGWRVHPITGTWKFHAGVDLGYEYGSGVPALWDGQVVQCGNFDDGYGNQVMLYHAAVDAYTRYAHLSAIYVNGGDGVSQGQVIGAVGATGNVTGPHLHLEYIARGEDGSYQYMNPLDLWR
jgi:murein DD-endopeptidase MepM/ murein hydrolase activator NlpD